MTVVKRAIKKSPEKQRQITLWDKEQLLAELQYKLEVMPVTSVREHNIWCKYAAEYGRMSGFYQPDTTVTNNNSILVVTREQSDEIWKQRVADQQRRLGKSSSLATNTR